MRLKFLVCGCLDCAAGLEFGRGELTGKNSHRLTRIDGIGNGKMLAW